MLQGRRAANNCAKCFSDIFMVVKFKQSFAKPRRENIQLVSYVYNERKHFFLSDGNRFSILSSPPKSIFLIKFMFRLNNHLSLCAAAPTSMCCPEVDA